jgi:hypothetical protein
MADEVIDSFNSKPNIGSLELEDNRFVLNSRFSSSDVQLRLHISIHKADGAFFICKLINTN